MIAAMQQIQHDPHRTETPFVTMGPGEELDYARRPKVSLTLVFCNIMSSAFNFLYVYLILYMLYDTLKLSIIGFLH